MSGIKEKKIVLALVTGMITKMFSLLEERRGPYFLVKNFKLNDN